jgi:peptidoglycan hydrolase-like protein with peptidoglycan-binding domain
MKEGCAMNQKDSIKFRIILLLVLFILSAFSTVMAMELLKEGAEGEAVTEVQQYLFELEYLSVAPTGYYGSLTDQAVRKFQFEYGLNPDGVVGPLTYQALKDAVNRKNQVVIHTVVEGDTLSALAVKYKTSVTEIMKKNKLTDTTIVEGQQLYIPVADRAQIASRSRSGKVQVIPWSVVNEFWKRGENAVIIDVATGKQFRVRRHGGHHHSDTVPLTAEDTKIMLEIFGGKFSWARRSVIVYVKNTYIAASMNGQPHGKTSIPNNNFDGHFCVHFLGSRLHKNGRVDDGHQALIQKAASFNFPGAEEVEEEERVGLLFTPEGE